MGKTTTILKKIGNALTKRLRSWWNGVCRWGWFILIVVIAIAVASSPFLPCYCLLCPWVCSSTERIKISFTAAAAVLLIANIVLAIIRIRKTDKQIDISIEQLGETQKSNLLNALRQDKDMLYDDALNKKIGAVHYLDSMAKENRDSPLWAKKVRDIFCDFIKNIPIPYEHEKGNTGEIQSMKTYLLQKLALFYKRDYDFYGVAKDPLILSDAELNGVDLSRLHLKKATFNGTILREANLSGAHLQGTTFTVADMRYTLLYRVRTDDDTILSDARLGFVVMDSTLWERLQTTFNKFTPDCTRFATPPKLYHTMVLKSHDKGEGDQEYTIDYYETKTSDKRTYDQHDIGDLMDILANEIKKEYPKKWEEKVGTIFSHIRRITRWPYPSNIPPPDEH